ncbi:hypothetical protein L7F22_060245 [Adiantum nelumboides]|nr:hypothetical protein [Adiantum nelumboides]
MVGKAKKGGGEGMRGAYTSVQEGQVICCKGWEGDQTATCDESHTVKGEANADRGGAVEVKEVRGNHFLAVSQPMDVVLKPCQPLPTKPATVTEERKKKALKVCKLAVVTKGGKKKALKAQQREQDLKNSKHSDQGSPPMADVAPKPCQGAPSMLDIAPKPCKGAQPEPLSCKPAAVTKGGKKEATKDQHTEQGLKIAMPVGQDAPLSTDVLRESCKALDQLGMLVAEGKEDKSSKESDDDGDEDDESSQDGGGDDSNDGSNDDAGDDDGGSDVSGCGDDNADGEDNGTNDSGGSDEGDIEGVSEQDDAQDVSDEALDAGLSREVQEVQDTPCLQTYPAMAFACQVALSTNKRSIKGLESINVGKDVKLATYDCMRASASGAVDD